jgi:hypothetical protein
MKFRPVGAELFHADGRTEGHDEAILAILPKRCKTVFTKPVINRSSRFSHKNYSFLEYGGV